MKVSAGFGAALALSALLAVMTAAPASASTSDPPSISFGSFASDGFSDVYASMLASNDPSDVAAYLHHAAQDPAASSTLPGLSNLTDEEAREILQQYAVEAASEDADEAGPQARRAGEPVQPLSLSTAPIVGKSTNNRYSWLYTNRFTWTECLLWVCTNVAWIDMRFTTDPGRVGSRTPVDFKEFGNSSKIRGVTLTSTIYASGANISNYTAAWNTPGYGTQWNTPHSSTTGKTFQAHYTVKVLAPDGYHASEYKTAKSATCKNPTTGAFNCLFP